MSAPSEMARLHRYLVFVAGVATNARVLKRLSQGLKDQTIHRITVEKTDPTGRTWRPWSAGYAKSRNSRDSLLVDNSTHPKGVKHLWQSFQTGTNLTEAVVFTDVDAAHQQDVRPFFGVSKENADNISEWLGTVLQRGEV